MPVDALVTVHFGDVAYLVAPDVAQRVARLRAAGDRHGALTLARDNHAGAPNIVPPGGRVSVPLMLADHLPDQFKQGLREMTTTPDMKVASVMVGDSRLYGDARLIDEIARLREEVEGQRGVITALSDAAVRAAPVAPAAPVAAPVLVDVASLPAAELYRIVEQNRANADTAYGRHVRSLGTAHKGSSASGV
jgi:hypothetical protein